MSTKGIGVDATVYTLTLLSSTGAEGSISNLLGQWENLEFTWENVWADTTSSDATEPQARPRMNKWSARLRSFVTESGSQAILGTESSFWIKVLFTEANSGRTAYLRGGVDRANIHFGAEAFKDDLELSSKGQLSPGLLSFDYL